MLIVPVMDHDPFSTCARIKPFITASARVPGGKHTYLYGWQHKRTREGASMQTWTPTKDTTMTWLQNDAGRAVWPVTTAAVKAAVDVFCGAPLPEGTAVRRR